MDVEKQVREIVDGVDQPRAGMKAAQALAADAIENMTGARRKLALALAGALADYSALDDEEATIGKHGR